MSIVEKLNIRQIFKVILSILSIPIVVKILYFINILGIYFGSFLREISNCIK